jgi:hypothetical protein
MPGGVPWAAALRGAAALALPLLLGLWTGHVIPAVFAGIGALWGMSQASSSPYPSRTRRQVALGLASAVGLLAGELALRSEQAAAVAGCLVATALVSGLISLRGPIVSVTGMQLLLGATVGSGIPVPGPWWQPPLDLLAGTALILVLSVSPWLWRRHRIERGAVLAAYRTAAEALAAVGTPCAENARRAMTLALNHAHEAMNRHLTATSRHRQKPEIRHLPTPCGWPYDSARRCRRWCGRQSPSRRR